MKLLKEQEQRRQRVLPVDSDTLSMLREYIRRGGPVIRDSKKLLFGINRHRSWQVIRDCAEKAGLPKLVTPETGKIHNISPHRLRDAFAVHAMKLDDSGDGLRLLQESITTTFTAPAIMAARSKVKSNVGIMSSFLLVRYSLLRQATVPMPFS